MNNHSLFVKIKNKIIHRATEWVISIQIVLWGLILLSPTDTFNSKTFAAIEKIVVSENYLGVFMLLMGLSRILMLIVNGSMKAMSPWIRFVGAWAGFLTFVLISVGFALSGNIGVWIAAWPVAAGVELFNIFRTTKDIKLYKEDS